MFYKQGASKLYELQILGNFVAALTAALGVSSTLHPFQYLIGALHRHVKMS
jgi:hypothetical protein